MDASVELRLELVFCIPGSKVEWIEGPGEAEGDGDGTELEPQRHEDAVGIL